MAVTYTENSAIGLFSQITDVDDTNMESATIVLTNKQAGDYFAIGGTAVGNGSIGSIGAIDYTVTDDGSSITIALFRLSQQGGLPGGDQLCHVREQLGGSIDRHPDDRRHCQRRHGCFQHGDGDRHRGRGQRRAGHRRAGQPAVRSGER